jgi:hypothetical protein
MGFGNIIELVAIFVNFGIPMIIIILVFMFILKKFKNFDSKLDKIIEMLNDIKK